MERRKFTREFKVEAVKLIQERGVTVAQSWCDLGVHGTALRRWVQECVVQSRRLVSTKPRKGSFRAAGAHS